MERKFELSTTQLLADLKLVEYENAFLRTAIDELEAELSTLRVLANGRKETPHAKPVTDSKKP